MRRLDLSVILCISICGGMGFVISQSLLNVIVYFFLNICVLCAGLGTFIVLKYLVLFSGPILVPLFAMHGILNPSFSTSYFFAEIIPIRADGLRYATNIGTFYVNVILLALPWVALDRLATINTLVRWRMPSLATFLVTEIFYVVSKMAKRITDTRDAQQGQGIPVRGSLYQRTLALPSVVVPTITTLLRDSDERASVLACRGLGTAPFAQFDPRPLTKRELALAVASCCLALGGVMWRAMGF